MTRDFQQCGMCDQQSLRSACAYAQSDQSLVEPQNFTFRKFYTVKNRYKFLRAREKLVPVRHIFHTNISHFVKFAHVVKLYVACMRNLHRDKIAPKSAAFAFDSNSSNICQNIITWFKQVTDKFHKFYS